MLKSRLLFGATCFVSVLFAGLYEDSRIGFLPVYTLAILLITAVLAALCAPLCLRFREHTGAADIFRDDELDYTVEVTNRSLFYYPSIVCTFYSEDLVAYGGTRIGAAPRSAVRSEKKLHFTYRGIYKVGLETITVTDFLGLFKVTFQVNHPMRITVYPESDPAFRTLIQQDSQETAHRYNLFNESMADVADVRKYAPADSFRKIHWKLSAKRGELMVKNYQSFEPNQTVLYLDTMQVPSGVADRAAFEDKVVSCAAAAVNHCATGRMPAFLVGGDDFSEAVVIEHEEPLDRVYRVLAGLVFEEERSPFPRFCHSLNSGDGTAYNLLLFLSRLDEEIYRAICQFTSLDHNLYIYYFFDPTLPEDELVSYYLEALQLQGIVIHRSVVWPPGKGPAPAYGESHSGEEWAG